MYAVQRFWFVRAWTWIATLSNSSWRLGLHAGLIAIAAALLGTMLDPLLGLAVSRIGFGGVNIGKSLATFARLWLVASFFGFLAVESVGAIEWITNCRHDRRARLRPEQSQEASVLRAGRSFNMQRFSPAAFPSSPPPTDSPPAVCATRSSASMCRSPIFRLSSTGSASRSSATSTSATTCRRMKLRAPLIWRTSCGPTFRLLPETSSPA